METYRYKTDASSGTIQAETLADAMALVRRLPQKPQLGNRPSLRTRLCRIPKTGIDTIPRCGKLPRPSGASQCAHRRNKRRSVCLRGSASATLLRGTAIGHGRAFS